MVSINEMPKTLRDARPGSGAMFDRIAARYDVLNRLMSLGMDRFWRRRLVQSLDIRGQARVLDVATGTADVAIAIANAHPQALVHGLDPSTGMLGVGQRKIDALHLAERVRLVEGDALALPFAARMFDATCISFGIRNVPDRLHGLREMVRVTRSGGNVAVLELSEPQGSLFSPMARFHMRWVVPWLGSVLSHRTQEYAYLPASISAFASPHAFTEMMVEAGLENVTCTRFAFGAANLFVGRVP